MKTILFSLLISVQMFASSFSEEIEINHSKFTFVQKSYTYFRDKGTKLLLYTSDANRSKKPLLAFDLENITGACSARGIKEGSYEIRGSQIVFYTRWKREGPANESPIGSKKEIYTVLEDGTLKRESSLIYMERYSQNKDLKSGMKYLYTKVNNAEEQSLLDHYVENVEMFYDAKFVFGEEAAKLQSEVTAAMKRKSKNRWK